MDTVCTIEILSLQVKPTDSDALQKNSSREVILANVMRLTRQVWQVKEDSSDPG